MAYLQIGLLIVGLALAALTGLSMTSSA